jgi:apolipoprotein N-acyltransferase
MSRLVSLFDRRPALWLLLGGLLISVSQVRWPIGALSWLIAIPFLRHLRITSGWAARMSLVAALLLAWTLATAKIVTDPLPPALALGFGLPMGLFAALPYLALGRLQDRLAPVGRVLLFAVLATGAEWLQRNGTPLLSWGALAQSQVENLPLMQVASCFGLAGVSFLIHGSGAALESALAGEVRSRKLVLGWMGAVLAVHVLGAVRLGAWSSDGHDMVPVAMVDTPSDIGGPTPPAPDTVRAWNETLFDRTRKAAASGAELVVWTEGSTLVEAADESEWRRQLSGLAEETGVELVVAYIVPLTWTPLRYENKLVWVRSDGSEAFDYLKHIPVPGEPAVAGTRPMPVVETAFGRASSAICYDYDSPALAHEQAQLGADIVALPSSDWRGIDPIHTQMAAVRAIEGGHSVVRSTRWGLSAAIDPLGRLVSWGSALDESDGVLLGRLPRAGVRTPYTVLGEGGVGLLLVLVAGAALLFGRRRAVVGG